MNCAERWFQSMMASARASGAAVVHSIPARAAANRVAFMANLLVRG
jgi:hypothetical protein